MLVLPTSSAPAARSRRTNSLSRGQGSARSDDLVIDGPAWQALGAGFAHVGRFPDGLGLPLIGALAHALEIEQRRGSGSCVRMRFLLTDG